MYNERLIKATSIGAFAVLIILIGFGQVSYNDFFWHLALGKWMLATHSFLTHDIFSYTFEGKLWLNGTWLYDSLLYYLYAHTGYWGLNILRCLAIGGTYWIFIKIATIKKKSLTLPSLVLFLPTLALIRNFIRPEITEALFIGTFLYALYRYKYSKSKLIYLLPVLEIIWVNTHGSFGLGLGLIFIFFAGELLRTCLKHRADILAGIRASTALKTFTFIGLASALGSLLNPYGYTIYLMTREILSNTESLAHIMEWLPTPLATFYSFPAAPILIVPLATWLLLFLFAAKTKLIARHEKKFTHLLENFFYEDVLVFALSTVLLLQHVRFLWLFSLIVVGLVIKNLGSVLSEKYIAPVNYGAMLIFPLVFWAAMNQNPANARLNIGPRINESPRESVEFLLKNKPAGPILNEYSDGSDLAWYLYPEYKIFIDGRTPNVYDNEFYWRYRHLTDDNIFKKMDDQYHFGIAILPIGTNSTLVKKLTDSKEWFLVFFDNKDLVLLRNTKKNESLIKDHTFEVLDPGRDAASYTSVCTPGKEKEKDILMNELVRNSQELEYPVYGSLVYATVIANCADSTTDQYTQAKALLEKNLPTLILNVRLLYMLGLLDIHLNNEAGALGYFEASNRIQENKDAMTGSGIALHNMGKYKEAAEIFKRIPYMAGGDGPIPEYYQIYGRVEYQLDNNVHATQLFHRYLDIVDPAKVTPQDYLDLSNAYTDTGDPAQSAHYAEQAKNFKPFIAPTTTPATK